MENKPLFFISCPIDTYSGYGAHSRDLVRAIIQLNKYDVKIIPQMWGNTPWGFIKENPEWEFLNKHIWNQPQLNKQPEMLTDQLTPFSMLLNQDNLNQSLFQNQQFIDQIFGLNNRQTNSNQESNQNIDCRYFN